MQNMHVLTTRYCLQRRRDKQFDNVTGALIQPMFRNINLNDYLWPRSTTNTDYQNNVILLNTLIKYNLVSILYFALLYSYDHSKQTATSTNLKIRHDLFKWIDMDYMETNYERRLSLWKQPAQAEPKPSRWPWIRKEDRMPEAVPSQCCHLIFDLVPTRWVIRLSLKNPEKRKWYK